MGRMVAAVLCAGLAFLLSGCVAEAASHRAFPPSPAAPLRLDLVAEEGLRFGRVLVLLEGRDGQDQVLYEGPVEGAQAAVGTLPSAGSDLRVLVEDPGRTVENGRSLSGDCIGPHATVTLGLFGTDPPVARVGIASACAPVPLG